MEERVHFYSTYDMSIPINIERADMVIKNTREQGDRYLFHGITKSVIINS